MSEAPDRRELADAAELLAACGKPREAIRLVERALLEQPHAVSDDTVLLIALLLFGTGEARDARRANKHLRKLHWRQVELHQRSRWIS